MPVKAAAYCSEEGWNGSAFRKYSKPFLSVQKLCQFTDQMLGCQ